MRNLHILVVILAAIVLIYSRQGSLANGSETFRFVVESARQTPNGWKITTPGANFTVQGNRVICEQRIGAKRVLASLRLQGVNSRTWQKVKADNSEIVLSNPQRSSTLTVSGDSVLRINGLPSVEVSGASGFDPQYRYKQVASALFADEYGGIGVYGPKGTGIKVVGLDSTGEFGISYSDLKGEDLLISVFPPRQFNWKQAQKESIVHFFPAHYPLETRQANNFYILSPNPLPTNEEIEKYANLGFNILVLHMEIWHGFGLKDIQPVDPDKFAACMREAHAKGFRVLLYTSPWFYHASCSVDDFLDEEKHILSYGADGLYWDGNYLDVEKAWECVRRTRELLSSRLLYIHCTASPFSDYRMVCPFIDTYADYTLRGEALDRTFMDPYYLRYVVSGYNMGNQIGTLCYDTTRLDSDMIKKALAANIRIPYWPGTQTYNKDYFLHPDELLAYLNEYLPIHRTITGESTLQGYLKAQQIRKEYRRTLLAEKAENMNALYTYLIKRKKVTGIGSPENIAAFKPVKASDVSMFGESEHKLGLRPEYANDRNDDTFWGADYAPQWLEVDLQRSEPIGRIVVRNYSKDKRSYTYEVQTSVDGVNYSVAARKRNETCWPTNATAKGDSFDLNSKWARFIRVVMLSNSMEASSNPGLHIVELEVFRPAPG